MKFMILMPLALLFLVAILGCRTRTFRGTVKVRAVSMWHLGEADLANGEIRLAATMKHHPDLMKMVCAHELGHVIGLEHQEKGTIMAPTHSHREPFISKLSKKEVELAGMLLARRELPILLDLSDLPEYAVSGMRWAVSLWNSSLVDPSNKDRGYVRVFQIK